MTTPADESRDRHPPLAVACAVIDAEALPDDAVFEQVMADDAAEEIACLRWLRDRFDLSAEDARIYLGAAMAWEIA